ncbi:uncharacterized protein [Euwallacea similis]|uniref:uncharacterized protein n=1 Tax=Euwallacea similis TaxID=1736056 RepID=UPI003451026C
MAVHYTNAEYTDMILVFGFCQGNGRECKDALGRLAALHLKQQIMDDRVFVRVPEVEEQILERVEEDPELSTRQIGTELALSKDVVHRVLTEQLLYLYHKTPVQDRLPQDSESRLRFYQFVMFQRETDVNFGRNVLFSDEAGFTRERITNCHNEHVYADENPHAIKTVHFQEEFRINVWAGILDNFIIDPVILPQQLTEEIYSQHLQNTLPGLLEDVPLQQRERIWFMHDGAPLHFTLIVRNYLNQQYPNKWIGRGNDAPVNWSPLSPDLNPLDFLLWGHLKSVVYRTPVTTQEELWQRIQNAVNDLPGNDEVMQRIQFNFIRRINFCVRVNGGHFE